MYTVYMHLFPNGKRYIGVTTWKPKLRWGADGGNYKNPYMKNAIKKYGWENIKHIIIAENLSFDEADKMEIELIKKYNSADKKYGYNISLGGIKNRICSDSTKEKLRIANLGKTMSEESKKKISNFQKGQVRSEETKKHMSEAQKKNFKSGNNAMHSPKARAKAKESLKGKKFPNHVLKKATEAKYRAVENIITGEKYQSIKDACEKTGLNQTTIIRHCKNKQKKIEWKYIY